MRDIPVIFSGPMVRALLAGRKTMTRRLAWRPARKGEPTGEGSRLAYQGDGFVKEVTGHFRPSPWRNVKPGDRLWVRESLTHVTSDPVTAEPCSVHCYSASIPPGMDSANPYEDNYLFPEECSPPLKPKSVPSIHMPRWASRLTLIVIATKIERLQDIGWNDAIAEGVVDTGRRDGAPYNHCIVPGIDGLMEHDAPTTFLSLWEHLHGDGAVNENPEVVAVSFRVIRANIDAIEAMAA